MNGRPTLGQRARQGESWVEAPPAQGAPGLVMGVSREETGGLATGARFADGRLLGVVDVQDVALRGWRERVGRRTSISEIYAGVPNKAKADGTPNS